MCTRVEKVESVCWIFFFCASCLAEKAVGVKTLLGTEGCSVGLGVPVIAPQTTKWLYSRVRFSFLGKKMRDHVDMSWYVLNRCMGLRLDLTMTIFQEVFEYSKCSKCRTNSSMCRPSGFQHCGGALGHALRGTTRSGNHDMSYGFILG